MARPPSTYDGRTTTGKPISAATSRASSRDVAVPLGRLRDAEVPQQLREALAVLGEIDRVGRRAEDLDAGRLQRQRELERRLTAVLHDARRRRRRRSCSRSMIAMTSSNVSGSKYSRSTVS